MRAYYEALNTLPRSFVVIGGLNSLTATCNARQPHVIFWHVDSLLSSLLSRGFVIYEATHTAGNRHDHFVVSGRDASKRVETPILFLYFFLHDGH